MLSFRDYKNEKYWDDLCESPLNESVAKYTNSLGIPRAKMPQIKSDDVPEFIDFLKERGIKSKTSKVAVKTLKPTQNEYNPDKVQKLTSAPKSVLSKIIIKSSDGYILDGHHRYGALLELDPNAKMNVIEVDQKMKDLLKSAFEFPKTFTKNIDQ